MDNRIGTLSPLPGHDRTTPHSFGQWVTVAEAVHICEDLGLGRDIKTIRRWAQRSHSCPENAEVLVHEQDTPTGFRYVIEHGSLVRKIAQELAFEADREKVDMSNHGHARPDMSDAENDQRTTVSQEWKVPDMPALVRPGPDIPGDEADPEVGKLSVSTVTDGFLKGQIAQKDRQIAQLDTRKNLPALIGLGFIDRTEVRS